VPDTLIESANPYGTRRASVLVGEGTVYLYLTDVSDGPHGPTVSATWVANLGPAPAQLDLRPAQAGSGPPLMGREGTKFPQGCPPPNGPLQVVWFEEGDGVALLDSDVILAVIPGWGGTDGFYGYARHCRERTEVAWPLASAEQATLDAKVASSRRFWSWRLGDGWKEVQQSGVAHLEARLGPQEEYWAIDGGRFPQIGASRHRIANRDVWVTATTGLSAQRMPKVEQFVDDPAAVGRIELVVARTVADDQGAAALSRLATIPFSRTTWFGSGHTVGGEAGSYPAFGPDKVGLLLHRRSTGDRRTAPARPAWPATPRRAGHLVVGAGQRCGDIGPRPVRRFRHRHPSHAVDRPNLGPQLTASPGSSAREPEAEPPSSAPRSTWPLGGGRSPRWSSVRAGTGTRSLR